MTTEIYKYLGRQDECIAYDQIKPGDYRSIVNINSAGDEEVIVAYCRQDNKCSVVYTIHPRTILFEAKPPLALYDRNETENRALVIWPGAEEVLKVRERIPGSKRLASARYRLSHR